MQGVKLDSRNIDFGSIDGSVENQLHEEYHLASDPDLEIEAKHCCTLS